MTEEAKKRKYTRYATPEKLAQVNEINKRHVERYFHSKAMNLSDTSKKSYMSDFNQWLVFIMERWDNQDVLKMDDMDLTDMLEEFVHFCATEFGNNERRIQRRLSSISSFYINYQRKRKIAVNPLNYIERPKIGKGEKPQIQQNFLTEDEVEKIRRGLKKIGDIQLELFFEFGLSTMARANAIASIKLSQVDIEKRKVYRVIEKEGYEVTLKFNERTQKLIKKWLDQRAKDGIECEYLFITKYKGTWNGVKKGTLQSSWIRKIGAIVDIPNLHCHDLRHSGATLRYRAGMKLESISKDLNHKGTQVTQDHYIKFDEEALAEEKDKFDI